MEQLFCLYGNRHIIDQVYFLQVKGSLVRWRAVLIYQLTRNIILLVKVINQYLENMDLIFRVLALKIDFGTNKY